MRINEMKTTFYWMIVAWMVCLTQPVFAGISGTQNNGGDYYTLELAGLAVVWGSEDIDVYYSSQLLELMNTSSIPDEFGGAVISRGDDFPPPSFTTQDLPWLLEQASALTVFFPDSSIVQTLSQEETDALGNRLRSGNAFVGTQGDLRTLITALNLPEQDDFDDSSDPAGSYVEFSYPKNDGVRDGLFLAFNGTWPVEDRSIGEIWTVVSGWAGDILKDQGTSILSTSSGMVAPAAWNNTFFKDFKGILDSGNGHLRVTGWKLDTTSTTSDWYLIKTELQSHIKEFRYLFAWAYAELGWYTSEQSISIKLGDGATLWDYMPNTAVRNITQGIDFTIGGDLGAKVDGEKFGGSVGVKAAVSFKQTYTAPEITLLDDTDKAENKTGVHVEYPLALWSFFPAYVGNPPPVSRSTYNLLNMFIAEVPKNKALGLTVSPKVTHRKDFLCSIPGVQQYQVFAGHSVIYDQRIWTASFRVSVGGQ